MVKKRKEPELPQPGASTAPLFSDPPVGHLLEAARSKGIRGAILLSGEDGIGKKRLALEMARLMNCDGDSAAGPCNSCRRILAGTHPDVTLVEPTGEVIKVEESRKIVEESLKKPYEARFRAVIVDAADRLHPSAGNALLKTLEEPPEHLVFFLLTSRPDDVLPTIRSRAPMHFLPTPPAARARAFLLGLGWPADEAERAVAFGGGRVGWALRGMHRKLDLWRDRWVEGFSFVAERGPAGLLPLAVDLADADDLDEVLRLGATLARDLRLIPDDPTGGEVHHRDIYGRLGDLGPRLDGRFLEELGIRLLEARERMRTNPNLRLFFEELFLGLGARYGGPTPSSPAR